jgi:hypothetical protein
MATSRVRQLVESLQTDLHGLAGEKKKPTVKLVSVASRVPSGIGGGFTTVWACGELHRVFVQSP